MLQMQTIFHKMHNNDKCQITNPEKKLHLISIADFKNTVIQKCQGQDKRRKIVQKHEKKDTENN